MPWASSKAFAQMADDFDAVTASLRGPGGWGVSGGGDSGLSKRLSSYDERLHEMRRHLREQQKRQKQNERSQKSREKEMAQKWMDFQAEARKKREKELKDRLSHAQESCRAPPSRKTTDAEPGARQRSQTATSVCELGGAGTRGSGSKAEIVSPSDRASLCDAGGSPRSSVVLPKPHRIIDVSPCLSAAGAAAIAGTATAASPVKKGTFPRVRKKKREEVALPSARSGGIQREKSIMQQAQEQFQGLCRSADGRAILDLGTRHQKMHRDALVKGDPVAVEKVEQEAEENGRGEEKQEVEDQEQPTIANKNMARRYRLRMMHQISSQVLQCRQNMTASMKESFLSPSGLGFSPQASMMSFRPHETSTNSVGHGW